MLRLLEDLSETTCVSAERIAEEVAMANHDLLVQAIRNSGVATARDEFFDGVRDLTIPVEESDTDDDGGTQLLARPSAPASRVVERPVKRPRTETRTPIVTDKSSSTKLLQSLSAQVNKAARLYVITDDRAKRLEIKEQLEALRAQVVALRKDLAPGS